MTMYNTYDTASFLVATNDGLRESLRLGFSVCGFRNESGGVYAVHKRKYRRREGRD